MSVPPLAETAETNQAAGAVVTFAQLNPPAGSTAEWSLNAEAAGLGGGAFYSVQGGQSGRGQFRIQIIHFPRGIFRTP